MRKRTTALLILSLILIVAACTPTASETEAAPTTA